MVLRIPRFVQRFHTIEKIFPPNSCFCLLNFVILGKTKGGIPSDEVVEKGTVLFKRNVWYIYRTRR